MAAFVLPLLLLVWAPGVAHAGAPPSPANHASVVAATNAGRVAALAAANPHARFSLATRWANMTREEFSRMHGLYVVEAAGVGADPGLPCQFTGHGTVPSLTPTAPALAGGLDWVARGATVPVKDQARQSFAEHWVATKAPRCTAIA